MVQYEQKALMIFGIFDGKRGIRNDMSIRMQVEVEQDKKGLQAADDLAGRMPESKAEWEAMLMQAEAEKQDIMEVRCFMLSQKPSVNFQVIGMMFRTYNTFLMQHEYPKHVRFVCSDKETATLYWQIYNYYIPATKEDRMQDEGWD
ncbi:MAG: hypothetical protein LUF92_01545 [Clostridiales bacterium]|nr:hypothetical protein [Clostridiales bacterium]